MSELRTLQSAGPRDARDAVELEIARLAPWFHNLHLPSGHETAPDHPLGDFPRTKWREFALELPDDLTGWTALDIGCNAGFYSFALASRGAQVTAIDHDEHYLRQARWAAPQFGFEDRVELRQMSVYDLARTDEQWDLILFMGVLYHLRHPLLALDLVAAHAKRLVVFQTLTTNGEEVHEPGPDTAIRSDELLEAGWPKMAFVEKRMAGDPTNWWIPSHACVEAMARSAGLRVVGRPGRELYLCEPRGLPRAVADELRAATASS